VISLHASNVFDAGPADIGMLFSAIALTQVVGMPLGSFLADRYPKKNLIVPAGACPPRVARGCARMLRSTG
jgi:MFS family permease